MTRKIKPVFNFYNYHLLYTKFKPVFIFINKNLQLKIVNKRVDKKQKKVYFIGIQQGDIPL